MKRAAKSAPRRGRRLRSAERLHTSVFGIARGHLPAARSKLNILPGITRGLVALDLAEACRHPVRGTSPSPATVSGRSTNCSVTGTTAEVLPIIEVE